MRGDDVAVIGLACRLPGAPDPAAFWRLLQKGRSAIGEAHRDGCAGTGGFLDRVDLFDAAFFRISPREAAGMDPQQRLMLELAWEAFEDAGVVPDRVRGSRTAVFAGAIWDDYATLALRRGRTAIGRHTLTGLHRGLIAGRISYALGLRGPSMTVDSGQSSSLVAVHLAVQSLGRGESSLALAGGVNLNLAAESTESMAASGALSPNGRCYPFDERANGIVRGEGGAVVLLKPLAGAEADGDPIYCVISGSAVNNDGATDGLTVPSAESQAELLREAYERAGVDPANVQYVELHGTGTPVGDPIEAAALGAALGRRRPGGSPLRVGSVKANVGHLEGAAGITGLAKVALSIAYRWLPPSLNFRAPNPEIPLDELNLRVQTSFTPWPSEGEPLVAGVSSFGVGGTNCHVVLTEPPPRRPDQPPPDERPVPWVLSARGEPALRAQAIRLYDHVAAHPDLMPVELARGLATTRSTFEHRAAVVGTTRDELLAGLRALADEQPKPRVLRGVVRRPGRTVLVFPGQGSQWLGMGVELLDSSTTFASAMGECEAALAPHVDWSLTHVLRGDPGAPPLDRIDVVQPVLFAMMVSLAELWRAHGVRPDAVLGTSQGEIAAACVAGGLELVDAAKVVARRGRIVAALAGRGAMAVVVEPAHRLRERLAQLSGRVGVAAVNGPRSTVVSGDECAVDELLEACAADRIQARRVKADYASHSPYVEAVRDELLAALDGITPRKGRVAFYSTVTGERFDTERLDAGYWYRNVREPIQLDRTVRTLLHSGHHGFIEVSPHPVLLTGIAETLDDAREAAPAFATSTLRRPNGGIRKFLTSLAEAHVHGTAVDWDAMFAGDHNRLMRLPTYPFQRQRFWLDPAALAERPAGPPSWVAKSAGLQPTDRHTAMLDLVRTAVVAILGYSTPDTVDAASSFKDLGMDSQGAAELHNWIMTATGLTLPTTLVIDHPTSDAVARLLVELQTRQLEPSATSNPADGTSRSQRGPAANTEIQCQRPSRKGH